MINSVVSSNMFSYENLLQCFAIYFAILFILLKTNAKEKMQKDKQRFIKHVHKTKDRVTRTQLRQGVISGVPEGQTVPAPLVTLVVVI
jgi:hypothetical protein